MKRYNNSNGNNDNHREIHEQCRRANLRAGEGVAEGRGGGSGEARDPAPGLTSMAGSVLLASVLLSPRMLPAERPSHS